MPPQPRPLHISSNRETAKQLVAMVAVFCAPISRHFTEGPERGLSRHSLLNSSNMSRDWHGFSQEQKSHPQIEWGWLEVFYSCCDYEMSLPLHFFCFIFLMTQKYLLMFRYNYPDIKLQLV